jgi:D-alanyl-lipoteichoic acid acyltransferase DltB (MBOAT superfamily)
MSFLFYGWWDWRFLFLILGSGFVDYFAALWMQRDPAHRKRYLAFSVFANIGSLALFKYLGFFTQTVNALLEVVGSGAAVPLLSLTLPVGISFYTFQSMSYTIDVYRGELEPTEDALHFFAYLSMFPQLVAGPIIRARDLLPQLTEWKPVSPEARFEGTRWIVHGYFKKVVVADNLAPFVNQAFGSLTFVPSGAYWWVVMSLFAVQIYCDFAGYSDIARGLARWMGYEFPRNFNHPYTATSMRDFWRRWHISLSTWFGDYVYIPLGGSRGGAWMAHRNLWITMVVSGLWHGAAWTFVAWGALHAAFSSFERVTHWPERVQRLWGGRALATLLVLAQVWIAWVFFRAESFSQAWNILGAMLNPLQSGLAAAAGIHERAYIFLGLVGLRELYLWLGLDSSRFARSSWWRYLEPPMLAFMLWASVFLRGEGSAFIYFQF